MKKNTMTLIIRVANPSQALLGWIDGQQFLDVKNVTGGVVVTPLSHQEGGETVYDIPAELQNEKLYVNVVERSPRNGCGETVIVCDTDGLELRPYFLVRPENQHDGVQAHFSAIAFVTLTGRKGGQPEIRRHSIVRGKGGLTAFIRSAHVMYDIEFFRAQAALLKKVECRNCTHVHYGLVS